jgi:CubicO group peptidase (beta-lactamase class C family)
VGNHAPHPDQEALGYAGEVRAPSFALDAVGRGAGDIWSTTRELAQWDAALAAPGLLSSDSLQALFAPQAAIPDDFGVPGLYYGYGWFVGAVEGRGWRYHGGANAGFTSMNLLVPDHHCVVILLANDGRADLWRISHRLVADLLGETGSAPSMVQ